MEGEALAAGLTYVGAEARERERTYVLCRVRSNQVKGKKKISRKKKDEGKKRLFRPARGTVT